MIMTGVRPKIENTGISLNKTFQAQLTLPSFDYHKKKKLTQQLNTIYNRRLPNFEDFHLLTLHTFSTNSPQITTLCRELPWTLKTLSIAKCGPAFHNLRTAYSPEVQDPQPEPPCPELDAHFRPVLVRGPSSKYSSRRCYLNLTPNSCN